MNCLMSKRRNEEESVIVFRGVCRGGSGGSGEPPFFQINYIHSMAWHACLACK